MNPMFPPPIVPNKPRVAPPTFYSAEDLSGEWEFKILTSENGAFRKAEALRRVCAEEARAGWILLEKISDIQLRFKRRISARANDANLDFDPYRTTYGMNVNNIIVLWFLLIILCAFGIYLWVMDHH
jgi:hypothetical protein